jgi:tyramine---L-glutamate ligase
MPVFVHEFFCSGAFDGDLGASSLAREGLAMLAALVEDFSRCDQIDGGVVTTLGARLRGVPRAARIAERAQVSWVESPAQERSLFLRLASRSQGTLVIAPETGGRLLERRRLTDAAGGRFLGPSPEAIGLCGDKLRLHEHLTRHFLPTLSTTRCDLSANNLDYPFPIVVKPRDGAGSVNTYLIHDRDELEQRREGLATAFAETSKEPIVQPYLAGRPLSVAALIGTGSDRIEVLPLAEQRLTGDDRFHYQGGRIPARDVSPQIVSAATQLVIETCGTLPGLSGYIGFDLILSAAEPCMRIVEVNPRLTTSYVGYRRLTSENIAARMLSSSPAGGQFERSVGDITWNKLAAVEFDADGAVRSLASFQQ